MSEEPADASDSVDAGSSGAAGESVDAPSPEAATETAPEAAAGGRIWGMPRWLVGLLPLVLLGLVIAGFVATSPFASFAVGEPLPDLTVTRTELPDQETMVVHVTNNGPDAVTVSQVLVDEAYWSHRIAGHADGTIGAGESARVVIPYHWTEGFDYDVTLVLDSGATVHHTIVAAQPTPGFSMDLLWTLAVIGLFVGIIPVVLGMLWFPFLQTMSDRWLHAVLAFSGGVLGFLAIDAGFEALELAEAVPGFFEGKALVALGALGTLLVVQSVSAWHDGDAGLRVAYLVALGIGLHNLAEGLAIGSSFALGRVSLGAFLVIGFMVHNVTEGPAVVAPVARGERPHLAHFVALGVLAGAPVVVGGWIGGLAFSPTVGALFLAVGVGAILQVLLELGGLVGRENLETAPNLLGFTVGLIVMYLTDLLIVI